MTFTGKNQALILLLPTETLHPPKSVLVTVQHTTKTFPVNCGQSQMERSNAGQFAPMMVCAITVQRTERTYAH